MKIKNPKVESISPCGIGPVPDGARRFLKRQLRRKMRRYVRLDVENTRPKPAHDGWYW